MTLPSSNTDIEQTDGISSLLLPLKEKQLLLPNVSVAEIIPFSQLLTTASPAKWILGQVSWRGLSVPVVCYELINDKPAPAPNTEERSAMEIGILGHAKLPFSQILIKGLQNPEKINKEDLQGVEGIENDDNDPFSVN